MLSTGRSTRNVQKIQSRSIINGKDVREGRRATASATKLYVPNRQLACSLHRQADQLHQKGDYEGALVLYHRAANLHPQNTSHSIAAKKMSDLILSSSTIPKKPLVSSAIKISKTQCPSLSSFSTTLQAAVDAEYRLKSTAFTAKNPSETSISHLELIDSYLKSLKTSFTASNFERTIEIGNYLLTIIPEGLADQYHHKVVIERYLSLAHLALNRHDRAVEHSIKMIEAAEKTRDVMLRIRSYVVLGKVHLTFGHLTAAAKGWECVLRSIVEPVPKAWLLHEIGRCYYEMGNDLKALEMARRCCDWADEGKSNKWIFYGKLLTAQVLIRLGRFGEALESLRRASTLSQLDNSENMSEYIANLMKMVGDALQRKLTKVVEKQCLTEIYSADLAAEDNETLSSSCRIQNDEFNGKLFTSRTQVIRAVDENSFEINKSEKTGVEINGACYIIDKWKKHLSDIKSTNNRPDKFIVQNVLKGDDTAPFNRDQQGNLVAQGDGTDDNDEDDDSEDSARTYDIDE